MLARMKVTLKATEKVRQQLQRLRTETDPKLRKDITALADCLERLLDGAAKGGRERAKKLSKKRRVEIATNAARARWASEEKET